MAVPNCPANVVIMDQQDNEFKCLARYYGDGRILVSHEDRRLMVDPEQYYEEDPKRLFDYDRKRWTKFRIKSVVLDSKFIVKNR